MPQVIQLTVRLRLRYMIPNFQRLHVRQILYKTMMQICAMQLLLIPLRLALTIVREQSQLKLRD